MAIFRHTATFLLCGERKYNADLCAIAESNSVATFNPDFPLGALSALFASWRRIFGHFRCSSLPIARYWRLIRNKTASKSAEKNASAIITNPNGMV